MFDLIKKVLFYKPKLSKDTPDINLPKEDIKEKTKEEALAENIIEKQNSCKKRELLNRAYKIPQNIHSCWLNNTQVVSRSKSVNGVMYSYVFPYLCTDYEYAETFYKYLCKAVDKINAHVEKKELRRRAKEIECMNKFIGDSIYDDPQAFNI
jgi:hypothetical protein